MSAYSEMLKDPRWQRRRLEVLQRQDFTCESCEATEKTLHVHHTYYEKGKKPWEYPDGALRCLCKDCHERVTGQQQTLARELARLSSWEIDQVIGYVRALASQTYNLETDTFTDHPVVAENGEQLMGIEEALSAQLRPEEVFAHLDQKTGAVDMPRLREFARQRRDKIWAALRSGGL